MPRRMAWRPTTTTAATRMLKLDMMNMICAAAARALFSSRWPMYWLATTAPPVASAVMICIIRVLKEWSPEVGRGESKHPSLPLARAERKAI